MARNAEDYKRHQHNELPKGYAWSDDENSNLGKLEHGTGEEYARIDARMEDLRRERDTRRAVELLEDHEVDLGIPDECSELAQTIQERQEYANAKLISHGRLNIQMFYEMAFDLGYEYPDDIYITEFKPFWAGIGCAGEACGENINLQYWMVSINAAFVNYIYFRAGSSSAGDPLIHVPGLDLLRCMFEKYKPAGTQIIWAEFGPGFSRGFSSGFDSLPASEHAYSGGFNKGFSEGFSVYHGGGFSMGFNSGFSREK